VTDAEKLGRTPIRDVDADLIAAVALSEHKGWLRVRTVQFPLPGGQVLGSVQNDASERRPRAVRQEHRTAHRERTQDEEGAEGARPR